MAINIHRIVHWLTGDEGIDNLITVEASVVNALKVAGSNYWNTANWNGATGFNL